MVREVRKLKDQLNRREMEAGLFASDLATIIGDALRTRESEVRRMSASSVASGDDLSATKGMPCASLYQEPQELAVEAPTYSDRSKSLPSGSIAHFSSILKNSEEKVTGRSPRTRSTHSPGPTGRSPISKTKLKVTRNHGSGESPAAAMIWLSSKPTSSSEGSGSPPRGGRKLDRQNSDAVSIDIASQPTMSELTEL